MMSASMDKHLMGGEVLEDHESTSGMKPRYRTVIWKRKP